MNHLNNIMRTVSEYDSAKLIALGFGLSLLGFGALLSAIIMFLTGETTGAIKTVLTITFPCIVIARFLMPIVSRIKKLENTPF